MTATTTLSKMCTTRSTVGIDLRPPSTRTPSLTQRARTFAGELRIAAPSNGYDFLFSAHAPFPGGFKLPPSQLMYSNAILCRTCKVANGVGEEWGITLPYSETQVKYIVDNMKFYPDRLSWAMASKSEPAITLYSPPEEGAWDIPGGEDDGTW